MKPYILYHGNCFDGFGAAYSAWKKFGDDAVYLPCIYGAPCPEVPEGSTVYMIDFSLKREEMLKLYMHCNKRLTVIDHHKTAEENLKGLDFAHFDMEKSGALLAWEFFHPDKDVPMLIEYISDRDLWTFKYSDTKEIHAGLASYPMDFQVWDNLHIEDLFQEGKTLLRYSNQVVDMICSQAHPMMLARYNIMAVNATSHWSEVGNALCKKYPESPFCASFYTDKFGNEKWSLRSIGDFDVSVVAKIFGGGGHRNAAGFEVKK